MEASTEERVDPYSYPYTKKNSPIVTSEGRGQEKDSLTDLYSNVFTNNISNNNNTNNNTNNNNEVAHAIKPHGRRRPYYGEDKEDMRTAASDSSRQSLINDWYDRNRSKNNRHVLDNVMAKKYSSEAKKIPSVRRKYYELRGKWVTSNLKEAVNKHLDPMLFNKADVTDLRDAHKPSDAKKLSNLVLLRIGQYITENCWSVYY
ncbi:unnamed protein product [Candidula unifasciata]|uniref:Uncharacterized protein n=1 Tax=Candidula unifasciata TaxID=100452 RepID=A0A8S3ZEM8_9EUPU|nr:unnamed protein product [Candidula unifasciata]